MKVAEANEMFEKTFGKSYLSVNMYFLKHLNRNRRVKMDVPVWKENKWIPNEVITYQELPKGHYFNEKFLLEVGITKKEDLEKQFTIYYECKIPTLRINVSRGLFENRNDAFDFYIEKMQKTKALQEQLIGIVPKPHVQTEQEFRDEVAKDPCGISDETLEEMKCEYMGSISESSNEKPNHYHH